MKKDRIFSFILAMLMLIAAAITVNKAVFSHNMQGKETFDDRSHEAVRENVTVGPDGSVIVHTAGLPGTISGYAGPVPLALGCAYAFSLDRLPDRMDGHGAFPGILV